MRFCEIRPFVRFADTVNYSIVRSPSYTYDSRLLFILSGEVEFTLADEVHKQLGEGAIVYFPQGTLYAFHPKGSFCGVAIDFDYTEEYKNECAIYPPILPSEYDERCVHKMSPLEDAPIFNAPFVLVDAFSMREEFSEIAGEFKRAQLFYRERCASLLNSILCKLARRDGSGEKKEETFRRIVAFIQSAKTSDVTNQSIAHALGFDACYLNRVMQSFTGLSLHQYVIKYRIDKAVALLLSTHISVEEVALLCGFYSTAHFSNQCLKQTGHRPSFYKNKSESL